MFTQFQSTLDTTQSIDPNEYKKAIIHHLAQAFEQKCSSLYGYLTEEGITIRLSKWTYGDIARDFTIENQDIVFVCPAVEQAKDFHTYLLTFEKLADKTSIYKGTARIVRGGPKMVNDGNLTVLEIGISNWAFKNYGIDFKAICNTAKAETLATAKKESTKATQTDLPKGNVSKQASRRSLFSSKDPTSRSSALDSSKELIAAALGIDEKTITSIISSDIQLGIITDTFKDAETLFNAIKTKLPKKEYGGLLRLGGTFKDRNIVELSFEAKKDFEDFLTNKPTTKLRSL